MSREKVIETAYNAVKLATSFTDDVEFSCEDAGRTDWDYMVEVLTAAIEAGATTLNIPDTVGFCVPEQFGDCIRALRERTPGIENCIISVHCHNDLGHATANSLAGVKAGARQIECTINGIGERAGNTSLEEVVMMLRVRRDYFGVDSTINAEEIYRASRLLSRITGQRVQANKAIVGANAFAHEAGIHQDGMIKERTTYEIMRPEDVGWTGESMVMGKHSGRNALARRMEELGIRGLGPDDISRVWDRFKDLCDLKKIVYDEDLLALVEDEVARSAATYQLEDLDARARMNDGIHVRVRVRCGPGDVREAACEEGDGQVDALYRALDTISDHAIRLLDYGIESVTSGKDAQGRVNVLMSIDGQEIRGVGLATDVIVASAHAYLNALNRFLMFKEINNRVAAETP